MTEREIKEYKGQILTVLQNNNKADMTEVADHLNLPLHVVMDLCRSLMKDGLLKIHEHR